MPESQLGNAVSPVGDALAASPLELSYAPLPSGRSRRFWVIPIGLLTTLIALGGSELFARYQEFDLMLWLPFQIVPAGPFIVGVIAGIGFIIGAQIAGVKPRRRFLVLVGLLLLAGYLASEFVEFSWRGPLTDRAGNPVGFWYYLHIKATSLSYVDSGGVGEPLGGWGYALRILQVGAFVAGGVLIATLTGGGGYCELCRRFKSTRDLLALPASVPEPADWKDDAIREKWNAECEAAMERAEVRLAELGQLAVDSHAAGFLSQAATERPGSRSAKKLAVSIRLELYYCPCCFDGVLLQRVHMKTDLSGSIEDLPSLPLSRDFVKAVITKTPPATEAEPTHPIA